MLYSKFIACNCEFSIFWCGLGEEYPTLSKRAFKVIIPCTNTYLREAGLSSVMTIKKHRYRLILKQRRI